MNTLVLIGLSTKQHNLKMADIDKLIQFGLTGIYTFCNKTTCAPTLDWHSSQHSVFMFYSLSHSKTKMQVKKYLKHNALISSDVTNKAMPSLCFLAVHPKALTKP